VFRVSTDPDHLDWFYNDAFPAPTEPIELDLRVGGAWRQRHSSARTCRNGSLTRTTGGATRSTASRPPSPSWRRLAERSRVGSNLDKEAVMALARVVSFDGVDSDRIAEMQREMEDGERPENVPAKEIVVLHDPEADRSLVILFFDTDEDYRVGDETLSAMPAGDTPGQRTSVTKYQVAFRMTD
jgi:hypothetical protein